MKTPVTPVAAATIILGLAVGATPGCRSTRGDGAPRGAAVQLDGLIDEWPEDAACVADGEYIYVRFAVQDEQFTLQHSPRTLAVYLDLDGDAESGVKDDAPSRDARGADMVVEFSPRHGGAEAGSGVGISAVDRDGTRRVVRHADVDLSFAPTFASSWYEMRISRFPAPACALAAPLGSASSVRGTIALLGEPGGEIKVSEAFYAVLPTRERASDADEGVPAREPGTLRVVSWNVLKSAPSQQPDAFARVFRCLDPDVVLIQEWAKDDGPAIQAWFTAFVPSPSGWQVVKSADGDVAIASRYPLGAAMSGARVEGDSRPVRFVAAVSRTPGGNVLLGSAHLKCCGGMDTPEDARRIAEARAIGEALRNERSLEPVRVLGGDMNLVGTRTPLDILRGGFDADGSDLEVAPAMVLGDRTFYTWTDAANEFTPGRLDYVLWSGASARAARQFVLDTARLSRAAIVRSGLRGDDSRASDHLPVVVDLVLPDAGGAVEPRAGGGR